MRILDQEARTRIRIIKKRKPLIEEKELIVVTISANVTIILNGTMNGYIVYLVCFNSTFLHVFEQCCVCIARGLSERDCTVS